MSMPQALTVTLPLLYAGAAGLYALAYAGERQPVWAQRARRALLLTAIAAHAALFALHARAHGEFPIQGVALTVSAVAWTTAVLFRLVTLRVPQPTVGSLVLTCVAALQWAAAAFGPVTTSAQATPKNAVAILHIVVMLLASAALVLSGVYGWLHLVQYRQMRRRAFGRLFRNLPSLELLSATTRRAALAGFVCLTVGLNVGIGLGHATPETAFRYTDPEVVLVMALWIHFGVIAFSGRIPGLNARRASYAALGGLLTLLAAIGVMAFPALSFHAF